ncbi:MAG: MTH1187 family thiamine-binding protein [Planctomycetota bacterium]|nr:MTH1187 family thiamine-binding protein [Planctomycetota bacterium]
MIIMEISVVPIGTATPSVSSYVAKVQKALEKAGYTTHLHSMGTVLEAESLDKILEAIRIAHSEAFRAGALRVLTSVKIDERRDKEGSIKQKLDSVKRQI